MSMFELKFLERHLYLSLGDQLWLFDTGAPQSFGEGGEAFYFGERVFGRFEFHGIGCQ